VVLLGDPLREHLENAIAADDDGFLARGDPLDVRIEHLPHRRQIAADESAVPAQEKLDARVTHACEFRALRGGQPTAVEDVRAPDDAEEGFRPQADARRIDMHRCPFRDLIESGDSPICVIHRGLIAGALETLDSDLEVERLDVFVEPGLCTAYLAPRNRKETR